MHPSPTGGMVRASPPGGDWTMTVMSRRWDRASLIAAIAVIGIAAHLVLRWGPVAWRAAQTTPLYVVLAAGGGPLVVSLTLKLVRRQFGSDLLAGISIVASVLLGEYLAGALVVLMLSGGQALEVFALGRASSVLQA